MYRCTISGGGRHYKKYPLLYYSFCNVSVPRGFCTNQKMARVQVSNQLVIVTKTVGTEISLQLFTKVLANRSMQHGSSSSWARILRWCKSNACRLQVLTYASLCNPRSYRRAKVGACTRGGIQSTPIGAIELPLVLDVSASGRCRYPCMSIFLRMFDGRRTTVLVLHLGLRHIPTWRFRPSSCRSKIGIHVGFFSIDWGWRYHRCQLWLARWPVTRGVRHRPVLALHRSSSFRHRPLHTEPRPATPRTRLPPT